MLRDSLGFALSPPIIKLLFLFKRLTIIFADLRDIFFRDVCLVLQCRNCEAFQKTHGFFQRGKVGALAVLNRFYNADVPKYLLGDDPLNRHDEIIAQLLMDLKPLYLSYSS